MTLDELHTCPLWATNDGPVIGMEPLPEGAPTPPVIGWVNVAVLDIGGDEFRIMLGPDAGR